jgi:lipopolysaccharide transport system permease protein
MAFLIIEAGKTERHYWADIWRYRELFFFLAWRDILVRYKQTVIGILWAVVRPVLTMIVFTIIFGKFAKMPSEGVPYPILVFAAMLPWQFFASSLSESSNSLISNANMISKVYFPRLVMPFSSVVVSLVDFLISFVLLIILMIGFGVPLTWKLFALVPLLVVAFLASLGASLWLAALNVKYRDFRYIVPFIVQFGLYVSPVGFSSTVVPAQWRMLYSLNPMVGVIDGFRWAVTGAETQIFWPGFLVSLLVIAAMLSGGVWYFRRMERTFADVI